MARVFPTLTEEQKQYLGEMASGNRNVKTLNAILSGWQDVEKAVSSAIDSTNSSLNENAKFMDSIEGKSQQLQSSFQEMSNSLIDSSSIKGLLDIGNALIQIVSIGDGVPAQIIAITAAIVALGAASKTITFKNITGNIKETIKDIGRPKILGFIFRFLGMLPQTRPSVCTHVSFNIKPIYACA